MVDHAVGSLIMAYKSGPVVLPLLNQKWPSLLHFRNYKPLPALPKKRQLGFRHSSRIVVAIPRVKPKKRGQFWHGIRCDVTSRRQALVGVPVQETVCRRITIILYGEVFPVRVHPLVRQQHAYIIVY